MFSNSAGRKAALDIDRVLELRAGFRRRLSDLSGGRYQILLADYVGEIVAGQPQLGEFVRANPEAHRVVALADDHRGPDSRHAGDRIHQVDGGVVGKEGLVKGVVRRVDGDGQQDVRRFLLHRDARS